MRDAEGHVRDIGGGLGTVATVNLVVDVRHALGFLTAQDNHPYLDTAAGMAAITEVAGRVGATDVAHLRTSEYVAATATLAGSRVLLRAGARSVSAWHAEELMMATLWARAGAAVACPLTTDVHHTQTAAVSVWPYLDHEPGETVDPVSAGAALARMHDLGTALGSTDVFANRPFRAPGKLARRMVEIATTAPAERGQLLVAVARTAAALTAEVTSREVRSTTIHGDFQPGNWLATPDGPIAVDFATSCWGPALWDLTLLEGRCGPGRWYPRDFWDRFCTGYGVHPDVLDGSPEQRLRRLSTLIARIRHPSGDTAGVWQELVTCAT